MISTKYSTDITIQKAESILKSEKEKQDSTCLLAYTPDTNEEIFRMSLLKTMLLFFDQSSHAIYLKWYRFLLFFWELNSIIPFMA